MDLLYRHRRHGSFIVAFCWLLAIKTTVSTDEENWSPISISGNSERSLNNNNYVVSSVPYIVDGKSPVNNVSSVEWSSAYGKRNDLVDVNYSIPDEIVADDECSKSDLENHQCVVKNSDGTEEATFRPYSQEELNKILQKYGNDKEEDMRAQESMNAAAATLYGDESSSSDHADKSKSWNLGNSQQQQIKNPYDERMGWVTLEPIAWSSSQVQKWEPNQKPNWPSPSQASNGHWNSGPQQQQLQPSYSWTTDRPWKRPTYQFQQQKPPWSNQQNYGAAKPSSQYNQDIITDGQPGYFPQERPSSPTSSGYRPSWNDYSSSSAFENHSRPPVYQSANNVGAAGDRPSAAHSSPDGDGHWVLLSSTKGYSIPHRQKSSVVARSLDLNNDRRQNESELTKSKSNPASSRRTVRLTVLPPLPGTTKTVKSHGGLIEVDSTKQTVDEAHREHLARMMRFQNTSNDDLERNHDYRTKSFETVRDPLPSTVTLPDKIRSSKRNALLTAVSAGMIPATMAMLLPLLMGRRKRNIPAPAKEPSRVVTLNFKKFDTPGLVTRYSRKENKDSPGKKLFTKSYAVYQ